MKLGEQCHFFEGTDQGIKGWSIADQADGMFNKGTYWTMTLSIGECMM